MNDTDRKRAKQIAGYPWFAHKKAWQKEIKRLLDNGFKLEVESLISKDISYVTEQYTPERLTAEGLAGLGQEQRVPSREIELAVKRRLAFQTDPKMHTFIPEA